MSNDKVDAAINQLNSKNIEIMRKLSSMNGSQGPESSNGNSNDNTTSGQKSDLASEMQDNIAKIQSMRQTGIATN